MTVSNDVQKNQSELTVVLAANLAANRAMLSKAGESAKRCLTAAVVQREQDTNELALIKGQHDQLVIRNRESKLLLEASLVASSEHNTVLQKTIDELNAELAAEDKQFKASEVQKEKLHEYSLSAMQGSHECTLEDIQFVQSALDSLEQQEAARERAEKEASDATINALKLQLQALKDQNTALKSKPVIPVLPPPPAPPAPQETLEQKRQRLIRKWG